MLGPSLNFHIQTLSHQFKVPVELIKKNFKAVQKLVENQRKHLSDQIALVTNTALLPQAKLQAVEMLIAQFELFQDNLDKLIAQDNDYRQRIQARARNLAVLDECCMVSDTSEKVLDLYSPRLMAWYRDQTNLLIVDYLVRSNRQRLHNVGIAMLRKLSQTNPGFELLADYQLLDDCNKIYLSLVQDHDLGPLVAWFREHRLNLKKSGSNLEFEISYCRYLSYICSHDILGAIRYAQQHLSPYGNHANYVLLDTDNWERNLERLKLMGGFFVLAPPARARTWSSRALDNTVALHLCQQLLEHGCWHALGQYFLDTFSQYYGLPTNYPLYTYLAAGLASLKTKSCYCNKENTVFKQDQEQQCPITNPNQDRNMPQQYYSQLHKVNHCPACSPELYALASSLPYAQLITSIFPQPYLLPNGHIFPFQKLLLEQKESWSVTDPLTKQEFPVASCIRVYPA